MTDLQHVYLTAHGSFTTGPWVGESAQFGIRLASVGVLNTPAKGTTFVLPIHGPVTVDQGQTAGTNGLLSRTWTARRGPVPSSENFDDAWQIDCAEDMRAFLYALRAYQAQSFSWSSVKLAPIGADGKTIGTSAVYALTVPIAGTQSNLLPPQVAMAITLRANILGRRGRGRIYLPALGQTDLDASGIVATATATAVRGAFVTLINALQNLPGVPQVVPLVVVMSAGSVDGVRPTEVRTGQRFDTIRSRRAQVPETYTTTQL